MNDFFRQIRQAFPLNRGRSLARKVNSAFNQLLVILKRGEYVFAERQRAERDRAEFLEQNRDTQVDQNVARNTDNRRANRLLWLVWIFEAILSYKGIQYLTDHFTGIPSSWWFLILPAGLAFASFAIYGSIMMNHFAQRFRQGNFATYAFLRAASYALVFIIPICNMLEAYESHGGPDGSSFTIALNWALVLITIFFHTSLVTMSNVFITAKNSKVALAELAKKDHALRKVESEVRALNTSFFNAKGVFSQRAREFVAGFKEIEGQNAEAARQLLYLLNNFTIWIINNKVYQHQVLPYHANKNGQPVVETEYFDPKLNSLVAGWDQLSSVTAYGGNGQDGELRGPAHPALEIPGGGPQSDGEQHVLQNTEDVLAAGDNVVNDGQDHSQLAEPILDSLEPNPNDKTL